MPHALPTVLGSGAQQRRAVIAQADGRQPPPDKQLSALRGRELQTFDHNRADPAIDDKAQAIGARATRGQPMLVEELDPGGGARSAQEFLEQAAEFSQAGLTTLFEQFVQPGDHATGKRGTDETGRMPAAPWVVTPPHGAVSRI